MFKTSKILQLIGYIVSIIGSIAIIVLSSLAISGSKNNDNTNFVVWISTFLIVISSIILILSTILLIFVLLLKQEKLKNLSIVSLISIIFGCLSLTSIFMFLITFPLVISGALLLSGGIIGMLYYNEKKDKENKNEVSST